MLTNTYYLTVITVTMTTNRGRITLAAIYRPLNRKISLQQYESFFSLLGNKSLAGDDFSVKHNSWDWRTNTPLGKVLEQTIRNPFTGHNSNWWTNSMPSAQEKTPDLLDFAIIKGLHKRQFTAQSCLDLISDHSPILIEY